MTATNPDVPATKGVPPVYRNETNPPNSGAGPEPLTSDGAITAVGPKGWGVYKASGEKALDPDSIFAVEPSREFRISDYPVEAGGFQSYNKVATPGEVHFTVTKGGKSSERLIFLRQIEALLETVDLYNIVTPDAVYSDYNISRRSYRRSAEEGAGLLKVDLVAIEVRQTVESAYTTTKEPSGTDPVNGGPVRPTTPTDAQNPPGPPS
jgi:hypothetical protein